jgi:hypothetical protein
MTDGNIKPIQSEIWVLFSKIRSKRRGPGVARGILRERNGNRDYPHFSGELLLVLSDVARLTRQLGTKHLKIMPVGTSAGRESAAASD